MSEFNVVALGARKSAARATVFGGLFIVSMLAPTFAFAAGTPANTLISNVASVTFVDPAGNPETVSSNTTTMRVNEVLDLTIVSNNPSPVPTSSPQSGNVLGFTLTNVGNGEEAFKLTANAAVPGDSYDPTNTQIFLDTNGNGQYDPGVDQPYVAGSNDPVLSPDESIVIFVINNTPPGRNGGDTGKVELSAVAVTGSGAPGTVFPGQGDGGVDAIVGSTGAAGTATGTYVVSQSVAATKVFSPASVSIGGNSLLTITLTNPTATVVTGAAFTDTYPAGLTNTATPAGATTCAGGTVTAAANGTAVALAGGTIPANGSCTVTVNVTSSVAGALTNTIPAGGITSTNGGSNVAPATGVITVVQSLTASKVFEPSANSVGAVSVLKITLNNANSSAITGAAFTDTYPTGLLNSATPNGATTCVGGVVTAAAGGNTVALAGGTIPANSSCTVTVNITSNTPGVLTNTIPVGGITTTNGGSNTDPVTGIYSVQQFNTTLVKSQTVTDPFNGAVPMPGAIVTYSLVFNLTSNTGAGDISGVKIADQIPAGTTYVANSLKLNGGALTDAVDADKGSYSGNGIEVDLGVLTAPSTQTVVFQVRIN